MLLLHGYSIEIPVAKKHAKPPLTAFITLFLKMRTLGSVGLALAGRPFHILPPPPSETLDTFVSDLMVLMALAPVLLVLPVMERLLLNGHEGGLGQLFLLLVGVPIAPLVSSCMVEKPEGLADLS